MRVVGSIPADEVPATSRPGQWSDLAARAVADHEDGKVTVVEAESRDEVKSLRNNLGNHLHKLGYTAHTVVVERRADAIEVYLQLAPYKGKTRRNHAAT